jgi:hypothetical protein
MLGYRFHKIIKKKRKTMNENDEIEDFFNVDVDAPETDPTPIQAKGIFGAAKAEDEQATKAREMDRLVGHLITPKGLVKLRAFGYDVVYKGLSQLPHTADGRSV